MYDLINWYSQNKRDLPWRNTTAWGVLVSEFMLQQTPVNRVQPVWEQWMNRWPTPAHLADAPLSDALRHWGRLGYPRRAKRLHECAQALVREYDGEIPSDIEKLRALPGIGEYTASAILAFAFAQPSVVLDINIRRLYARCWSGVDAPSSSPNNSERELAKSLIPPDDDGTWAAATMELGALICKARNPLCEECPLSSQCLWRSLDYPLREEQQRKSENWHGSDRQCRGVIMKALRDAESVSSSALAKLWKNQSQYEKAIASLLDDGLIQKRGKSFSLAHS